MLLLLRNWRGLWSPYDSPTIHHPVFRRRRACACERSVSSAIRSIFEKWLMIFQNLQLFNYLFCCSFIYSLVYALKMHSCCFVKTRTFLSLIDIWPLYYKMFKNTGNLFQSLLCFNTIMLLKIIPYTILYTRAHTKRPLI